MEAERELHHCHLGVRNLEPFEYILEISQKLLEQLHHELGNDEFLELQATRRYKNMF